MNPSPLSTVDLRDIHATAAPEFWPPAPGWWLLGIAITVVALYVGRQLTRAWRYRKLQNSVLAELDNLSAHTPVEIATHTSTLLRRVALMCFDRNEVASLSGDAWLAFLDRTGGNGAFTTGVGQVLATAPYAAHDTHAADSDALLSLARQWISRNMRQQVKHS